MCMYSFSPDESDGSARWTLKSAVPGWVGCAGRRCSRPRAQCEMPAYFYRLTHTLGWTIRDLDTVGRRTVEDLNDGSHGRDDGWRG